jgi:hypothetical protein
VAGQGDFWRFETIIDRTGWLIVVAEENSEDNMVFVNKL